MNGHLKVHSDSDSKVMQQQVKDDAQQEHPTANHAPFQFYTPPFRVPLSSEPFFIYRHNTTCTCSKLIPDHELWSPPEFAYSNSPVKSLAASSWDLSRRCLNGVRFWRPAFLRHLPVCGQSCLMSLSYFVALTSVFDCLSLRFHYQLKFCNNICRGS